jgi:hypothetical protein
VSELELACMRDLAPLLGRSPRALKRFVNTYRLLKVRAGDAEAFLREDPPIAPYRATAFLLALCTGMPDRAAGFIDAVLASRGQRVRDAFEVGSPAMDAWLASADGAGWGDLDLADLRPAALEVVRFTFHWHQSRYS